MHNLLNSHSEILDYPQYQNDYQKNFWQITSPGFWKLERGQTFIESDYPPYDAFEQGDWDKALELIEAERPRLAEYFTKIATHNFTFNRVRVVEKPIVPYLQWEFHMLLLRAQCGENIRVVTSDQVSEWEEDKILPETVILGERVLYQPNYGQDNSIGQIEKFTDLNLIRRCQGFVETLYQTGEDITTFFEREISQLSPAR